MQKKTNTTTLNKLTARALLALTVMSGAASAQKITPTITADQAYAGWYRQDTADTVSQLILLEDHTYCLALVGGASDSLSGGRWQATPTPNNGIVLNEVKPERPLLPAFAKNVPEQGTQVVFHFHGPSLSRAQVPFFGTSTVDALPTTLRLLFPFGHNNWEHDYAAPAVEASSARYVFVGDVVLQADGKEQTHIVQYKLETTSTLNGHNKAPNHVLIGFDPEQATPPTQLQAQLVQDTLQINGRSFGVKRAISAEAIANIRRQCIDPALNPIPLSTSPRSDGSVVLTPVRTFVFKNDEIILKTNPLFGKKDDKTKK